MKVKRFSTTRDEGLKCTDPESYIDENGILYPPTSKDANTGLVFDSQF